MDVKEIFLLRSYRLKAVGREALGEIVHLFPGPWIIRVLDEYKAALAFWHRAIPAVANPDIESDIIDDGQRKWKVFRFMAPGQEGTDNTTAERPGAR
jgi:predicted acetyltransferase